MIALIIWLIAWAVEGAPELHEWNSWAVALIGCVAFTVGARDWS